MRALVVLTLVGCGRIAFAPARDASEDVGGDAGIAGLVAWFPLEDTSGDTFVDVIGGTVGTCASPSCPIAASGHRGQGYRFDAVDDCISVPDLNGHFDLPELTVAIWAKQDALTSLAESQASKRVDVASNARNSWQLEDYNTGQLAFTSDHGTANNVQLYTAFNTIIPGTWQHLAISWDGTTRRIYVDGAPAGADSQPTPLAYDSHAVSIGCDDNMGIAESFGGVLDELQIYNHALTDAEVAQLAAQ